MSHDRNGNPLPGPQGGDDPQVMRGLAIAAARNEATETYAKRGHAGAVPGAGYPWTEFARRTR